MSDLLQNAPGNEDNHYSGNYQPIDFIEDQDLGFHEANAIKYICRWKKKNGIEDLQKAIWYLQRLIEHTNGILIREENLKRIENNFKNSKEREYNVTRST